MAAVPSIGRASRIEGAAAPEADFTRALYEQYANQIFRYCLHQLGSREEAEDAVQSTFLNAFRGLRRGVVPELESAWLFKIAHNVCLSRRRSTWRRGRIESPADFDVVEEVTPAPSRRADELMGLQDVLEEMPENQRRAILLREWQGLSYREIAEELELSQAAVETLIFRARRSLAQGLQQPPEPKRKRLARAADFGNILAGIKSALVGGSAAVKVAATVAVVSGSTVVATAPVQTHRSHQPKTPPPASAPERSSSSASSEAPGAVAASPPGGLRAAVEHRGTQGPAATAPDVRAHRGAATPESSTIAAPPVVQAPDPEPAPVQPVVTPPSRPDQPAAAAPAAPQNGESEKAKPETRTESRPQSSTETTTAPAAGKSDNSRANESGKGSDGGAKDGKDKEKPKDERQSSPVVTPVTPATVPTVTTTTQTPTVPTMTTASISTPAPKSGGNGNQGDGSGGSAPAVTQPQPTLPAPAPTLTSVFLNTPAAAPSGIQAAAQRDKDKDK